MIGRESELGQLYELYESSSFEFAIVYGRRRVGKTTLLQEFARNKNAVFYPAQEKNDRLNLADFSEIIQLHFDGMKRSPFQSWKEAFDYIGERARTKTAVIIDEFPYIAGANASMKSMLQHAIDHSWKNNPNIMLVLCGSSMSFMETGVMGVNSPLYGRQTATLKVRPFDYLDSSKFFPSYSNEQRLIAYGILGGVPRYLETFDQSLSIRQNIAQKIVRNGTYLHSEPANLLRAELRETSIYNSILAAIARGYDRTIEISDYTDETPGKISKYLITLKALKLIEKVVPCGYPRNSRKSIYSITDNYLAFWFRYIFDNGAYYSMLSDDAAAAQIENDLPNLMENVFKKTCCEYLTRKAGRGELPFVPDSIGRWWGTNPETKAKENVDILLLDHSGKEALFVKCKYASSPLSRAEYEDLKDAMLGFPEVERSHIALFSKSGYRESVEWEAKQDGATLFTMDDLFDA